MRKSMGQGSKKNLERQTDEMTALAILICMVALVLMFGVVMAFNAWMAS